MLGTLRVARSGRLWRKPASLGFAVAAAFIVAMVTPPAVLAAPAAPRSSVQKPIVPPAGQVPAALLAPQPHHTSVAAPSHPARTMNPAATAEAKRKAAAASTAPSATTKPAAPAAPATGSLFNGLNKPGLSAADEGNTATPPDSTGAIGPTRYVEMVNQMVGVYDRTNLSLLSQLDLGSFSHVPAGLATSDPQIQWDPVANRWLYGLVGVATGNNYLLFGWTKTSDPSDLANGWCTYGASTGSNLQDYPKLGHDAHFVTFGSNVYDDSKSGFPFVTANVWAFPKPAATDTTCSSPVTATVFADAAHPLKNSDGTLSFTPVPANTTDNANDYIVGVRDVSVAAASKAMVWHLEARPAATLVADGDIAVGASYSMPPSVPQPGVSYLIDSLDGRFTQAVARFDPTAGAEALWTQQTVAGSGRSAVRWYEFLPARGSIYQQGVLQSSTDFYFNGAISPSSAGNDAAIFYNRGSATLLSMIGAQTRTSSTARGQMDAGEVALGSSAAANQEAAFSTNCSPNPCRWGDYSGASPDLSNAHVVWGSNQIDGPAYFGYAQWTTQNFALSTVPPTADFSLSASPSSQTIIVGAGTSYAISVARVAGFATAVNLSLSGLPAGAVGSFNPNPASAATSTLSVTTSSSTQAGTYPLAIKGTAGALTRTASATLVVNPVPPPDFSLSASPSSQTVGQGAGTAYTVGVARVGGFGGAVSLGLAGLPSGASGTFSPNPAPGATSTLSVTVGAATPPGTYPLTVTGTSGSLVRTASASLVVTPPPPCATASLSPATATQAVGATINFSAGSSGCSNPQYEYWAQFPDGSWRMQRSFSVDPTWSWTTSGLAPGVYTVHVWANQVGDSTALGEAIGSSTVTLTACTTATLSPASVSQGVGSTVAFTAASSGCSNPQYQYWVQFLDGSWSIQRPFSTDPTWNWNTTGLAPGGYTVHVWANQVGDSTALGEAIGSSTVTLVGCASASLSPANTSQPVGSTIHFSASSSGCSSPQYQFWVQFLDGSWSIQRPFSTDPTWNWNTAGLAAGTYTVHVWANQVGDSTALGEAIGSSSVTLAGCTSAGISPASTSQPLGATIHLSASSTGCSNPQYQYWVQFLDGSWSIQRSFSTDPTWNWNTTGLGPGTYTVHVWANQVGDPTALGEAIGSSTVSLVGCGSAAIAPANVTQEVASTVSFTAGSSGCANPQYEYWVQFLDGSWSMQRGFSTDPKWSWNTAGLRQGVYTVHVWANQVGDSTALGEAIGSSTVTLTGCTSDSLSPASGSAPAGSVVTFTASSTGCSRPIYEFWLQDTSGNWQMVQGFSTNNTWQWSTAGWPRGTYNLHVWANQQGADTSTWGANGGATYTLT